MEYELRIMPRAARQMRKLPRDVAERIDSAILMLGRDLQGDVKRLVNREPKYRLRVGDYRILFNIDGDAVIIHDVSHRRESYRGR